MARDRQGRDRARRDPLQGAARRDPPDGRRARDGDDDVRRRSRSPPSASTRCPRPSEVKTTKRELDIAKQLVDSLAGDFEPDKYRDTYREEVLDADRAQGRRARRSPCSPRPRRSPAPAPDLMSALKASLDAVRERDGARATAPPSRAKPRRKRPPRKPPRKAAAAKHPAGRRRKPAGQESRRQTRRRQAVGAAAPREQGRRRRRQAARAASASLKRATAPNATSTRPQPRARSARPERRAARRRRAALRDPRAPRHAPALGPAPGARRRARLVGGAQGPAARRPRRTTSRRATEDHPLEYLDFHGEIPQGPVRRRDDDDLGQRHLRVPEVGAAQGRGRAARRARCDARYALFPIDAGRARRRTG